MRKQSLMNAYEQLLVIKGMHYGLLTMEEFEIVSAYYKLDINSQAELLEKLKIAGGNMIDSDQLFRILEKKQNEEKTCANSNGIIINTESNVLLSKLLRSNLPPKLRLMWMHEIIDNNDAIQVLMCISQNKTSTEIISFLKKTQEEIRIIEQLILHAYKCAYQKYRRKQPRAHRHKSIRDFYT